MTRERLDGWCEKGIVAGVVAILVFGPLATGAVRTPDFLVIQVLTAGVLLLWLPRIWLTASYRLLWPPACWAVVLFVAYAGFRYSESDLHYVARQELIRVVTMAILFFVILNNFTRQESTQLVSIILVFLAMAISIYAVVQFATHSDRVWHFVRPSNYVGRGSGTFINPNHLAGFLEMILPMALAFAMIGRVGHVTRVMLVYASLAILTGISVTISRGGWLATGGSLALLFVLLLQKRQYRIPALLLMGGLIIAGLLFYNKSHTSQRRLEPMLASGIPDDSRVRLELWSSAIEMWQDHVWQGVGPGHFDYRFPQYRPFYVQARPGYVHNDYLNFLVDWGVIGCALLLVVWALVFTGVFRTWKYVRRDGNSLGTQSSNRAAFVLGATVGLVAILIHSVFDFNMHIPANAILAVTLLALLSSHLRYASESFRFRVRIPSRILATLVGVAGVVVLGSQASRSAQEYIWFARARTEPEAVRKLEALKRAATLEPSNFETTYAIGESLRQLSWQGEAGFEKLAAEAVQWFQRGMLLNPYDAYNHMRIGMCLDWLGRHDEAAPYYEAALRLDPNNYYLQAHQGWHFVQTGDYQSAKDWFEKSMKTMPWGNFIAMNYLLIVDRKLKEIPSAR